MGWPTCSYFSMINHTWRDCVCGLKDLVKLSGTIDVLLTLNNYCSEKR